MKSLSITFSRDSLDAYSSICLFVSWDNLDWCRICSYSGKLTNFQSPVFVSKMIPLEDVWRGR